MHEQFPSQNAKVENRKKCILKQKRFINYQVCSTQKTQEVLSSPSSQRYESTNSTSNSEEEELRIQPQQNSQLRLKLKRKVQLDTEDEYSALICLINIKKRQRTSPKPDQGEKSHQTDQIIEDKEEVLSTPQQTPTAENQSIIIKLPSLAEHKQLQLALSQNVQSENYQALAPGFFNSHFSQNYTQTLFQQIDQNPNSRDQGLQQYLQISNLLLK